MILAILIGLAAAQDPPAPEVQAAPAPEVQAAPTPEVQAAPAQEVQAAPAQEVQAAPAPEVQRAPPPEAEAAPVAPAAPPPAPVAPPEQVSAEAAPLPTSYADVSFAELYQVRDITLLGLDAMASLTFSVPSAWELTGDPELHLRLDHSAMLDSDRSSLTIKVNDVTLHTVALDRGNAVDGTLVVPLPARLLSGYNQLQFEASQHVLKDCEDPYDPALWTRVLSESSIRFNRDERPTDASLSGFPDLLLDPTGHGPMALTLAGRGPLTEATLSALGRVGVGLGRHAGYRGLEVLETVTDPALAESHVLVVGTPAENPLIGALVNVTALRPGQGLVQAVPHPTWPGLAVLVITGADAAGLAKAAIAVSSAEARELLSGSRVLIDESRALALPALEQVPRPVPPALSFTMADLGIPDQTVRGTFSRAVTVPLSFEADSRVRPDGASMRLDFAYGAQLDPQRSTVEVLLNGVSLRSVALDHEDGDPDAHLELDLRDALVHPASQVTVVFHMVPAAQKACTLQRNRQLWATVFESSRFEVDRAHTAELPDLASCAMTCGLWARVWTATAWPSCCRTAPAGAVLGPRSRPQRSSGA